MKTLPTNVTDEIRELAADPQTQLTVRRLFDFGCTGSPAMLLPSAQFLHHELPVRLAHMTLALEDLPCGLSEMPSVRNVLGLYIQSFDDIARTPFPHTVAEEREFTALLESIKKRHRRVVATMASGLIELKERRPDDGAHIDVQRFLDRFYTSRIGIRMLIGQHIALHRHVEGWAGIIQGAASPALVAQEAADRATMICRMNYGEAPEVQLLGEIDLTFTYIPSHLSYMFFELLKNSLRATVEKHSGDAELPPVKMIFAHDDDDVAVKIADEGGGIPRGGLDRIWSYLYTTAKPPDPMATGPVDLDPMAGLGYGLPIARLYARYFGGDLQITSMHGYGTDALLYLNRIGDQEEVLP